MLRAAPTRKQPAAAAMRNGIGTPHARHDRAWGYQCIATRGSHKRRARAARDKCFSAPPGATGRG
eukprot:8808300-Pyramimonas_sp.AAC.1